MSVRAVVTAKNDTDDIRNGFPSELKVDGRIREQQVGDYITDVTTNPRSTREVVVARLEAASEDEEAEYISLFAYFSSRQRYGVVRAGGPIKDFYLVPVAATELAPEFLGEAAAEILRGEAGKSDVVLAVMVFGTSRRISSSSEHKPRKSLPSTASVPLDNEVYDPTADFDIGG